MNSNILPFVCSNIGEFYDEREYLINITFPKIKETLDKININFDPIQIDWDETDDYVRSGHLLRLLLHNIQHSAPFFLCLLGQQYGPYFEKKDSSIEALISESSMREMSWIEKNLLVASQTGYNYLINPITYHNSFLEFQINAALFEEKNYPFYRFYYRQIEYLDEKFMHLSIEERKKALRAYEPENSYCEFKIKDLKMKIAKKGLIVKYYSSLEQLDNFIYDDIIEMMQVFLGTNLSLSKPRSLQLQETFIFNKLNNYLLTDTVKDTIKNIDIFLKQKTAHNVHFKLENEDPYLVNGDNDYNNHFEVDSRGSFEQSDDYLEILKLRHINISNSIAKPNNQKLNQKQILLMVGPRGKGKTSFFACLYYYYCLSVSPPASFVSLKENFSKLNEIRTVHKDAFFLFYFLRPTDYLINVIINITQKMRAKYLKKDCTASLNNELHDTKSIIDQFHAALNLGPAYIFIDGLSELETKNTIKLNTWLPSNLENNCKFIITLSKSSGYYSEFMSRKTSISHELSIFKEESDYRNIFGKFFGLNLNSLNNLNINHSNNVLYGKFMSFFNELKTAAHISKPLYVQLIAQEIFSFDKEIYNTHPVHISRRISQLDPRRNSLDKSLVEGHEIVASNRSSSPNRSSNSIQSSVSVNVINSYIEEVLTLREIIQKILTRYIKKYNWSIDPNISISIPENHGWIGDVLCLIALAQHGITKDSIMRILELKGYTGDLRVTEFDWRIFRMQFGSFVQDGLNGIVIFSHHYFKEAVQTLLLDGYGVTVGRKTDGNLPNCKKNISEKQKEMHSYIIIDLLQNSLNKSDFDFCSQIENKDNLDNTELSQRYVGILHELIHHLYMIYDLVNLCKILTSFKVIHIFYENRMIFLNEWFDFCDCIKTTTNLDILRSILFSSLTIGMPKYVFEIKNDVLSFKKINQEDLDVYLNKIEYSEVKQYRNKSLASTNSVNDISPKFHKFSSHKKSLDMSLSQQIQSKTSATGSIISKVQLKEGELMDMSVYYEPFVDNLLDLTDLIDFSDSEYGDSQNLLFINRTLLFDDLMKHLDDKYFQENYSFLLFQIINSIITKNYPLNDTEKYKYSYLLQMLAKMSMQINDFDLAIKYLIKGIEILEDLFSSFHISNIDCKIKTKMHVLQISNRLSFMNSNMALLLLKMNNLEGASILLSKANSYNSERLNEAVANVQSELSFTSGIEKNGKNLAEKYDNKNLIHRESLADIQLQAKKESNEPNESETDDSGSFEAKYFYYFISGLFEVQAMNFRNANKLFDLALSLSIKWFGAYHLNTSKIYHYYGCFFSLKDMEFYNYRRAELYLRKALYIIEKEKKAQNEQKLKSANTPVPSNTGLNTERSFAETSMLSNRNSQAKFSGLEGSNEELNYEKLNINEDENRIAEILFDLGLLLITFDSKISKRESIDCLRRALDIKVLILGENHSDCKIIKKRLNQTVIEYSQYLTQVSKSQSQCANGRVESVTSSLSIRSNSSLKSYSEITPKKKIEMLRRQNTFDVETESNNDLSKWIKKNSIIEVIPSKRLGSSTIRSTESKTTTQKTVSQSVDNEFLQTSIYADQNDNFPNQPNTSYIQDIKQTNNEANITVTLISNSKTSNKQQAMPVKENILFDMPDSLRVSPVKNILAKLPRSISVNATLGNNKNNKTRNEIHSRSCRCPTAVSIDVHNVKTVSGQVGPHSNLRTLLDIKNTGFLFADGEYKNGTTSNNKTVAQNDVKTKILKRIYYKSAWYDLPPGSSKRRFKSYIKLAPNA